MRTRRNGKIKSKDDQIVIGIIARFNCLFNDGIFQIMLIPSFNFNLNAEVVESITSRPFSLLSALQF